MHVLKEQEWEEVRNQNVSPTWGGIWKLRAILESFSFIPNKTRGWPVGGRAGVSPKVESHLKHTCLWKYSEKAVCVEGSFFGSTPSTTWVSKWLPGMENTATLTLFLHYPVVHRNRVTGPVLEDICSAYPLLHLSEEQVQVQKEPLTMSFFVKARISKGRKGR